MKISKASSLLQPAMQQKVRGALATGTPITVAPAKPDEVPAFVSYLESSHGSALLATYMSKHAQAPGIKLDSATQQITDQAINQALQSLPPSAAPSFTPETLTVGTLVGASVGAIFSLVRAAGPSGATGHLITIVAGALLGATITGGIELGLTGGASGRPTPFRLTSPDRTAGW